MNQLQASVLFDKVSGMITKDVKLLAVTLACILGLVVLTVLAPVYVMPDGTSERHLAWNAPQSTVVRVRDKLPPDAVKNLNADPSRRRAIEALMNQPVLVTCQPVYVGTLGEPDFNVLGYLTMLSVVAWLLFAGYKASLILIAKIEEQRQEKPKKQAFPYDVRRLSDKRRR
jgi:hypothetical protein